MSSENVVIVDGARTPIGGWKGILSEKNPEALVCVAIQEALHRAGLKGDDVDCVVVGNVFQAHSNDAYLARFAATNSGIPLSVPAYTINRLCCTGLDAIFFGSLLIGTKRAKLVIVAGVETMSRLSERQIACGLTDPIIKSSMAKSSEDLALVYGITREEQDLLACESHRKAIAAKNRLRIEIIEDMPEDEPPRVPNLNQIERCKPIWNHAPWLETTIKNITPANSSGLNDGAAALVLTTQEIAIAKGLKPIGKIISSGSSATQPIKWAVAATNAIKNALALSSILWNDIHLFELSETFAAQFLTLEKDLLENGYSLDRTKVNVNGGMIALGHPFAASGIRQALTLLYELRRKNKQYGLCAISAGSGQGAALLVEANSGDTILRT